MSAVVLSDIKCANAATEYALLKSFEDQAFAVYTTLSRMEDGPKSRSAYAALAAECIKAAALAKAWLEASARTAA